MSVVVLMVVIFLLESSLKVCGEERLPVVINTWPFTEATEEGMILLHTRLICQEYYANII